MPNWCENRTIISSKNYKKIRKILDKINTDVSFNMGYGNLRVFDTLYSMKSIIINDYNIVSDIDDFKKLMTYMYKNLMHVRLDDGNYISDIKIQHIENIFDIARRHMLQEECIVDRYKQVEHKRAMFSLLLDEIHPLTGYKVNGSGFIDLIPTVERKDILNENLIYESYWDWTRQALGCKWDMEDICINDGDSDIVLSEECKEGSPEVRYYIELNYNTAWGPPLEFLERLSKKYKVTVDSKYYETGMCFAGHIIIKKGKVISDDRCDGDTVDCERLMGYEEDEIMYSMCDQLQDVEGDEDEYNNLNRFIKTSEERDYLTNGHFKISTELCGDDTSVRNLFKPEK